MFSIHLWLLRIILIICIQKWKSDIYINKKLTIIKADVSDDILSIIGLFVGPCRMNKSHFYICLQGKKKKTKRQKIKLSLLFLYLSHNVYIILDILHNNGNNSYTIRLDINSFYGSVNDYKRGCLVPYKPFSFFLHLLKMADIKSHCLLYCFLL